MSALAINTRLATRCAAPAGTPLLERVCMFCKDTLGWVVCIPEADGERSHGACGPCAEGEKRKLRAAADLRREYTLEIGTGCDEHPTQAATPCATDGSMPTGGAVNANATNHDEALRGPVSSFLPAVGGAEEAAKFNGTAVGPTENAPGVQDSLKENPKSQADKSQQEENQ
jgi:hypothetical protein